MSAAPAKVGTLYLVPTPLDFGMDVEAGALDTWLPRETLAVASGLTHWITENARSTRAFLKRLDAAAGIAAPVQGQQITELSRAAHKKGDHAAQAQGDAEARELLAPALHGHDVGLVSEAGMPAIADPGSAVVRSAHALGMRVVPLTGPVSLMLALSASGLNGQNFAFVGYVPQEATERSRRLRELEALALKTGQTQILIETPYRNTALLKALMQVLHPHSRLAVCCAMSLPQQVSRSALVSEWRRNPDIAGALPLDLPAVFLFGR